MKKLTVTNWDNVPNSYTGIVEWFDGKKEWWVNGLRSREDGPALEWPDGHKEWFFNGKFIGSSKYLIDLNDNITFVGSNSISYYKVLTNKSVVYCKSQDPRDKKIYSTIPYYRNLYFLTTEQIYEAEYETSIKR